ncbi:MAG: hypothetical protein LBV47_08730 [Bacteroidales bacterium]|jgi:hypothetical protein|nr:hypothetical protein [Bacteroidales bacterium]
MKTICRLLILVLAVVVFAACQKDIIENNGINKGSEEIVVVDNTIKSPQWLINVLDDIAHKYQPSPETGIYPYPTVYSVEYKGEEYILVSDVWSATIGQYFYTLSGEPVDMFSDLYEVLSDANRTHLW